MSHFRVFCVICDRSRDCERAWHEWDTGPDDVSEGSWRSALEVPRNDPSVGSPWWHGWHDAGWRLRTLHWTNGHVSESWCCQEHTECGIDAPIMSWVEAEHLAERIRLAAPRARADVSQLYDGRPFVGINYEYHDSAGGGSSGGPITSEQDWQQYKQHMPASVFQPKGARRVKPDAAVHVSLL